VTSLATGERVDLGENQKVTLCKNVMNRSLARFVD
jgi:hypothetical protein